MAEHILDVLINPTHSVDLSSYSPLSNLFGRHVAQQIPVSSCINCRSRSQHPAIIVVLSMAAQQIPAPSLSNSVVANPIFCLFSVMYQQVSIFACHVCCHMVCLANSNPYRMYQQQSIINNLRNIKSECLQHRSIICDNLTPVWRYQYQQSIIIS